MIKTSEKGAGVNICFPALARKGRAGEFITGEEGQDNGCLPSAWSSLVRAFKCVQQVCGGALRLAGLTDGRQLFLSSSAAGH